MKSYVVLEVGCLECDEESMVLLITDDELEAIDYYNIENSLSTGGMPLDVGETKTIGRLQLHCYED